MVYIKFVVNVLNRGGEKKKKRKKKRKRDSPNLGKCFLVAAPCTPRF